MRNQALFEQAKLQDLSDKLAHFRKEFLFPTYKGKTVRYFAGNSLGLQPKKLKHAVSQFLDDWQEKGVTGHFEGENAWLNYHQFLQKPLALLAGAKETEVVAMNSLTVNLQLLLTSFYQPKAKKCKILVENPIFPSDLYAIRSQIALKNFDAERDIIFVNPAENAHSIADEAVINAITENHEEIALVLLSGVNYYSGQAFDLENIAKTCQNLNIPLGLDLAHAMGNVPLHLHDWGVDFAVWCSYKYLNSGAGNVGGAFVHEKHFATKLPKLEGWWGHSVTNRFLMDGTPAPILGADAWQLSNPPIIALAAQRAALSLFEEAGLGNIWTKQQALKQFLLQNLPKSTDYSVITPLGFGSQVSLYFHETGYAEKMYAYLHQQAIETDLRKPNVLRIAPVPLYNTFEDIAELLSVLENR